jgi:lysophospholipase L1-like esterase
VELGARLALPRASALEALVAEPRSLRGLLGDESRRGRSDRVPAFEVDPLLFWKLRPGLDEVLWAGTLVSTNSLGFRYPREVGPKPEGGLRVLCLGDSVTFGYQVPLVRRDAPGDYDRSALPYPALLEKRLERRFPGRSVEVMPLAVPGYSSHQGRAWLRRDLAGLEADAVVVAFGWNDADLRGATDRVAMPGGWLHLLSRHVVLRSQALLHASSVLRRPVPRAAPPTRAVPRVPQDHFVANHRAMARLAARHGVPLLTLGPIYRDPVTAPETARRIAESRSALAAAMNGSGVAYIEVRELTEAGHPGNAGLFIEEVHPNAAGHARLAAAVEKGLADAGILEAPATAARDAAGEPSPEHRQPDRLTDRATGR